jgi:hypothetical protein
MFKLSIGDTIYLANELTDSSVIGKVTSYTVGKDINGEELILTVHLKGITSFSLAKTHSWTSDEDIWTVDEVNSCAPEYVMPEFEEISKLADDLFDKYKGSNRVGEMYGDND